MGRVRVVEGATVLCEEIGGVTITHLWGKSLHPRAHTGRCGLAVALPNTGLELHTHLWGRGPSIPAGLDGPMRSCRFLQSLSLISPCRLYAVRRGTRTLHGGGESRGVSRGVRFNDLGTFGRANRVPKADAAVRQVKMNLI